MQLLAYRSLYLIISSNPQFTKIVSSLAKISQVIYQDKNYKQKKHKCWLCNKIFDHCFMLIVHLQLFHNGSVQKYEIKNQCLIIVMKTKYQLQKLQNKIAQGYMVGLDKNKYGNTSKMMDGNYLSKNYTIVGKGPAFLTGSFNIRTKNIVNSIVQKIYKPTLTKQRIYFHSTNIFKRIDPEAIDQDSQQDIGQVQRQLQKLRIQDFSDVNDNDKKFFILWNGFIHDYKKKKYIIFTYDIPKLFIQFSGIAYKQGIPRINLVMHAWTLWSVGQITSNDVLLGLDRYDQVANNVINLQGSQEIMGDGNNNGNNMIGN